VIRVLVVDDHAVVREGLRHVLSDEHGFTVVGEARDGADALVQAASTAPDVVLLDLTMPGTGGLTAAEQLRAAVPACRILILTMHEHGEYVIQAVRAGAHGYVLKDSAPAELRDAIRAVHQGKPFFGPQVAEAMREGLQAERRIDKLTPREREVMEHVAQGATNKEIAGALGISPRTVESHRESLMKKLAVRSVAELTRLALEHGMRRS
jgi:DNA-binding NarL/FixJ family response regulator